MRDRYGPSDDLCQEHPDKYLSLKSMYEQATKDAEALETFLIEIGIRSVQVNEDRDPDEVGADRIIVAKYIERLQSAIQGRKEANERFSLADKLPDDQYIGTLEGKLPGATAIAEALGGGPKDGTVRMEVLREVIEIAAAPSIPRLDIGKHIAAAGRDNYGQLAICEAQLAHTFQRCSVLVLPSNRFCAGHHEDFKALKERLDLCVKHVSEYRDQIRWGLQYREGRDPGVELCDFPINHEKLLDRIDMHDMLLQEEVSRLRKYAGRFSYLRTNMFGQQNFELGEENERLMSEEDERRRKVDAKHYRWIPAALNKSLEERDSEKSPK